MDLKDGLLEFEKMLLNQSMEEKQRKDQKALSQIRLQLSNHIIQYILKEETEAYG